MNKTCDGSGLVKDDAGRDVLCKTCGGNPANSKECGGPTDPRVESGELPGAAPPVESNDNKPMTDDEIVDAVAKALVASKVFSDRLATFLRSDPNFMAEVSGLDAQDMRGLASSVISSLKEDKAFQEAIRGKDGQSPSLEDVIGLLSANVKKDASFVKSLKPEIAVQKAPVALKLDSATPQEIAARCNDLVDLLVAAGIFKK